MPRDFPNMDSLKRASEAWKFRLPYKGETEDQYRTALANYVESRDYIESLEIRNKVGWDKFSDAQNYDMLRRKGIIK